MIRKSDYPKIFRRAKYIFRRKQKRNRHQKISTTVFWQIRQKLTFQKSVKTPIKKKVIGAFFRNCLRMQKAPIKFVKFGRWDIALVCGPGSRKHSPLPQSGLAASAAICRGSGYPIRSCFRDNPPNVRRACKVTWEVCWPLVGQNIKMTNVVRGDTGGRFWQGTQKQRQSETDFRRN